MAKKSARKPNAAFMKPVMPNGHLAVIVGAQPLPRTELTRKLWAYIKKNGLQDKRVRTQINADAKLKPIFGGKSSVGMFELSKRVSINIELPGDERPRRGVRPNLSPQDNAGPGA
jgi:chromatin remodeling complex protein RSC6